jgi:site-specific recombinase
MSQKVSLADLISIGTFQKNKWDWNWYTLFMTWFFTTNKKTTLDQKLDYLTHLLDNNTQFREMFVQKWTAFMEHIQFDSLWVHTFSGESDSFFQELIWALNQKFISVPPQGYEVTYLVDEVLQLDVEPHEYHYFDKSRLEKIFSYLDAEKVARFQVEMKASLVRAIYILCSKNMSDVYSSVFKLSSSDKFNSDFVKVLNVINLTAISDMTALKKLNTNNVETIDKTVEAFRETGVSLNALFRIKKIKSRLQRIAHLIKFYESLNFKSLSAILTERKNFYSVKFQFFHYSSQLIEVVSLTSAETGDHYVGRSRQAISKLFYSACGGGFITGFTVLIKTLSSYLHMAPFLSGLMHGLNYAISFIIIYLLGFTLATKQPAAIAAHLTYQWQKLTKTQILEEIDAVFKSQFWAVLGNVGIVIPTVLIFSYISELVFQQNFMTAEKAQAQIASMSIFSFSPFYAFLTGYLLWFSTFISGVADNFFRVYKFHELILNSPKVLSFLSPSKKRKWANFLQNNFGALSGNAVLGFSLGIVPVLGEFLGLPIDVRHVTLSSGTIAAAIYTLGLDVFSHPEVYFAITGVIVTGILNLSVSFMISLRVAESSNALSEKSLDQTYSKSLLNLYILKKLGFRR